MRRVLPYVAGALILTGCGQEGRAGSAPAFGSAPTTPASLAYVAAQHVGEPDSAGEGSNWEEVFRREPVQAELRYGSTGEYDGDAVQVVVGRGLVEPITRCAQLEGQVDGCEDVEDGFWYWGEEEPEEDPGGVFVLQRKGPVTVLVAYYGPAIRGDPREQDLPVEVGALLDLAADPRVDLTTDADAVEQGAAAGYWRE